VVRKLLAMTVCGVALCACSPPAWRDPATAHGSAEPAPEVLKVAHLEAAARAPVTKAQFVTADPMPPPPPWAAELIGKSLRIAYPAVGDCIGNTDSVKLRFGGGRGGSKVAGWSWDAAQKAPVPRVVLVDPDFRVVGAGEAGTRRRDVPRAVPAVTTDFAGWEALTPLNAGSVDAWGILPDGKTICRLGHLDL